MAKKPKISDIDDDVIRHLSNLLDETGLTEIEYGKDDAYIRVARNTGTAPAAASVAPAPSATPGEAESEAAPSEADHPGVVTSPMVGIVYMSAEPGAPAFIKVGDQVVEGDTLLLIEAMKVFNTIKAPRSGKITRIFISSGNPVEFGEPLLIIE